MYILKSHKSVREHMAVLFGFVGVNVAVQTRRRVAPTFDDVAFFLFDALHHLGREIILHFR